jgi:hypothetical protein
MQLYGRGLDTLTALVDSALRQPPHATRALSISQGVSAASPTANWNDVLSESYLNSLLYSTNLGYPANPVLLPLNNTCATCGGKTYYECAFPAIIYKSSRSASTRMTTATVFRCKPCNIIYYHGFRRLPRVSDDDTRRFQYDMDFTKYKYFPVLPLTYLSLEFVESLDAKFANKAVSFLALAAEFNQRQGIFVPTPMLKKFADSLHQDMDVCQFSVLPIVFAH